MRSETSARATTAACLAAAFAVTGLAMAASGLPARKALESRMAARAAGQAAAAAGSRHRPAPSRPASRPAGDAAVNRPRDVGGARLAGGGIVVSGGALPLPAVPASAYVIADARTGAVLAAKDPHGLFPPASTLKVLTAITMLPRLRPGAMITASGLAASVQPNIIGLIPGRRYRVADLFRALLLISANDAAVALVQASGSYPAGIALLNAEAHHLRAYDVVARTPNGLPAPGQVVSAYDLALIARQALAMPAFLRYDQTLAATFSGTRFGRVAMVNQNALLTQYPGGIGGKIGWTARAGATYIGMARRDGVTLIVTILHAVPLTEIHSAEQLLDWGFAMDGRVRPVGVLVPPLR
ncbi:MAG TPA: D-alanyl-D-alanine carboxypeptidase [Streptosporangiaceae bacterium]|nr:D-alanyl-D-alanine carboxypeptidase [Streptosporangiaceae bacterium]